MSKLSTPFLIVLAIVAVVGIGGWRSASGKIATTTTELTTLSNKLVEATTKLAEQGATTETLRVQLNLQKTDLADTSNQIVLANAQLSERGSRIHMLESALGNRDSQIAAVNRSNAQLHASINELQTQTLAAQTALETARAQIAEAGKKLDSTASALNEAESSKAALLAKLSDPSILRSQMKSVAAPPASSSTHPAQAKLSLKPDGTVEVIPRLKPTKVVPIYSEPPAENTNAPKIIITY